MTRILQTKTLLKMHSKGGNTLNFYINQSIIINYIRIGSISNSSVFQIGSAGMIKPVSHLYNTGNFIGPAPKAKPLSNQEITPIVPLTAPSP